MDSLRKNDKEFIRNNRLILKSQQRFRRENHNAFIEEVKRITLSASNDKIMQSIVSVETYAYRTRKDLVCIKRRN